VKVSPVRAVLLFVFSKRRFHDLALELSKARLAWKIRER